MLVFDTESDGLLDELTVIHCLNMVDRETGERLRFNDHPDRAGRPPNGTIRDGLKRLEEAAEIAGHNIRGHDLPALKKVYPDFNPQGYVHDTLTYSRLIWTNLKDEDFKRIKRRKLPLDFQQRGLVGKHGLEAWGERSGVSKGDYAKVKEAEAKALGITDKDEITRFVWGTFNPEMDDYCANDCEVTLWLIERIEAKGYSSESLELETRVADIIDQQEKHGVLFDVPVAERLAGEMTAELADLDTKLRTAFKPWYAPTFYKGRVVEKTPSRKVWLRGHNTDGDPVKFSVEAGHAHCPLRLMEFSPGSRQMIADRLTTLFKWEPQEFTPTGQAKIDETTLGGLDYPEAKLLIDYLTISKRLGFLATGDNALLKMVGPDGRIHGRVNSNGAVTGRMTHFKPNLAQVPKVKVDADGNPIKGLAGGYGYELRSLFIAPKGKVLVGVDAESGELVMLSHYMAKHDGGAYGKMVIEGKKSEGTDVHTTNQHLVGLNSRDNAKTWKYAYLYGAGDWKLGVTEYEDMGDKARASFNAKYEEGTSRTQALMRLGRSGRSKIEKGLPALGALQSGVKSRAKKFGYLTGLDGRRLHVRGLHSALNTLLQGALAVVMKKALVLTYDAFLARGWEWGREFAFVLNIHDEFQIEAEETLAEEIGQIATDAIRRAAQAFNLRIPLSGSKDIGRSWAQTH